MRQAEVILMLAAAVAVSTSRDAVGADENIEGTWQVTGAEVKGKTYPAPKGSDDTWAFQKNKIVRKSKGKVELDGTFTLDTKQKPAHLDLMTKGDGKEMMVTKCVYQFTPDGLRVALPFDQARGERPTTFDSQKAVILILRRVKP